MADNETKPEGKVLFEKQQREEGVVDEEVAVGEDRTHCGDWNKQKTGTGQHIRDAGRTGGEHEEGDSAVGPVVAVVTTPGWGQKPGDQVSRSPCQRRQPAHLGGLVSGVFRP